jgi:hypothetical protein
MQVDRRQEDLRGQVCRNVRVVHPSSDEALDCDEVFSIEGLECIWVCRDAREVGTWRRVVRWPPCVTSNLGPSSVYSTAVRESFSS